jgi:cell filamentation protein
MKKDVPMVLENKLGITNPIILAREEERLSKIRAIQMYDEGYFDALVPGTTESLQAIHKKLFGDIYDFAGQLRTVDISKGNFRFASCLYLEDALRQVEKLPQSTFDEIVKKYVEMNVIHPFREGNGRSMRIWLDLIFKQELRVVVDWEQIDRRDYLLAMERSVVKDTEINALLKDAITTNIDDRGLFMKGIDASYRYEAQATYRMIDLDRQANAQDNEPVR